MEKEELNRLILEQIEKISDNVEFQNDDNLHKEIQGWLITNKKLTVTSHLVYLFQSDSFWSYEVWAP